MKGGLKSCGESVSRSKMANRSRSDRGERMRWRERGRERE